MHVETFFDPATWTLTYVVSDPVTRDAVIIDPVLDFDPASGRLTEVAVGKVAAYVDAEKLNVRLILETHAHADHITGAQALKRRYGAPVGIGEKITIVQATFAGALELGDDFPVDGSQFDRLLADGEDVTAGSLTVHVMATPGHTPACTSFRIGDAVFTGDALFMPDYGVGRCDFPAGDADALYTSVHERLYALPEDTRVFVGHDYQPGGRELKYETTIGASKLGNVHIRDATKREEFVAFRTARDKTLSAPRLLFPSIQVNVAAGRLPRPSATGGRFLKMPLKAPPGSEM